MKLTAASGTTVYLDADDEEIGEYSAAGGLQRRYIPGPEIDRPIGWMNAAGTKRYFHADRRGSIVAVTTPAGAVSEGPYSYDEYGLPSVTSGTPIRYTGRRYDADTTLYYYRARYYRPDIGRFLQTDPVGYDGGMNLYDYVQSDPINKTDPSGTQAQAAVVFCAGPQAIGCGVAAAVATGVAVCAGNADCRKAVQDTGRAVGDYVNGLIHHNEQAGSDGDTNTGPEPTSEPEKNSNPYQGPVDRPVVVVDSDGNAIPVEEGEQMTTNPSGDYQQVRDSKGNETGTRMDRGGHRTQNDPRAQGPHGHRPDTYDNGNPHLPLRPREH